MKKVIAIIFSAIWLLALLGCGIYYFAFAPRDSRYSEEENRNLAGFPKADFDIVISGDFGEDIEEYFLDSFPGRNYINAKVKAAKSVISIATYEDYLAIAAGAKDPLDDEADLGDISDLLEETTKPVSKPEKPTEDNSSEPGTDSTEPDEPKENPPIEEKPPVNLEDLNNQYFVYADSGNGPSPILTYEKNNIAAVTAVLNKYAALLPENGKVMFTVAMQSMYLNRFVTPTNQTICYGDWDDMVNSYGANNVYAFDTEEILSSAIKRGEYVSFRTDIHWTPYGAYLVYQQMAARAGKESADYENDFNHDLWTPFRGTYYRDNQSAYESVLPDELDLLTPKYTTEVRRVTAKDEYVLIDFIDYNARDNDRYTMYLGGPAGPWTYLVSDNGETENCLVVTDSFGMCFLPFLTDNYKEVHYYDSRYYSYDAVGYTVAEMIEKHNIQDIYVIVADFHAFNSSFIITNANKHIYNE